MSNVTQSQDMNTLESLLDRYDLAKVLSMLSDICYEKADHLYWQDHTAARNWRCDGRKLNTLADKVHN